MNQPGVRLLVNHQHCGRTGCGKNTMEDQHGNEVAIGDTVCVPEIYQGLLDLLPEDELPHIPGMLDNEYLIDDVHE